MPRPTARGKRQNLFACREYMDFASKLRIGTEPKSSALKKSSFSKIEAASYTKYFYLSWNLRPLHDYCKRAWGESKNDMEAKWMDKAEKAIEAAKKMNDPRGKRQMLVIAEGDNTPAKTPPQAEVPKSRLN